MALLLKYLFNVYTTALEELSDPRVENWFFMNSVFPILGVVAFYLYFVLDLGPKLMEKRSPFNIDKLLIIYNIIQIAACVHIVYMFIFHVIPYYSFRCQPVDYSETEQALFIARYVWYYFAIKIVDLLDTVFFVVRKKQKQVTFLHVYHHAGMVMLTWVGVKFVAGGSGVYIGGINCLVHAVMYSYYLLTVWNKEFKKSVWWKKHITQLQLLQFGLILVLLIQLTFQSNCGYPRIIPIVLIPQNFFMFVLFGDFYIKEYIKPKKVAAKINQEKIE